MLYHFRFNLEDFVSRCGYMVRTPPGPSTCSTPNSYNMPNSSAGTSSNEGTNTLF